METAYIIRNGVIIGEAGKDGKDGVQISDNETVEDKTWSSKKTSDEIASLISDANLTSTTSTWSGSAISKRLANWNTQNTNFTGNPNDLSIGTWVSINTSNYATNMPNRNGWATVITFAANNNVTYKQQLCLYTNDSLFYIRTCFNGVWSDWQELATMDKLNYSTTETPIGTWIDGKPIYRKVISFPSFELKPNEWNSVNSLSITGIDEVINARAKRSNDNAIIPLAARSSGTSIEVNPSTNFGISKLILEYTKQ